MEEYIEKLMVQFTLATGTITKDLENKSVLDDFSSWIVDRKKIEGIYLSLLEYNEIDLNDSTEIGKGSFDTLVEGSESTIITPFYEGIDHDYLVKGDFYVMSDGIPLVRKISDKKYSDKELLRIRGVFTQNPYSKKSLYNWEKLHNNKRLDIIVGVYGFLYEKDYEDKIKSLERFKNSLYRKYIESYATYNDTYAYFIASEEEPLKMTFKQ